MCPVAGGQAVSQMTLDQAPGYFGPPMDGAFAELKRGTVAQSMNKETASVSQSAGTILLRLPLCTLMPDDFLIIGIKCVVLTHKGSKALCSGHRIVR